MVLTPCAFVPWSSRKLKCVNEELHDGARWRTWIGGVNVRAVSEKTYRFSEEGVVRGGAKNEFWFDGIGLDNFKLRK